MAAARTLSLMPLTTSIADRPPNRREFQRA
jgi:hypothetical protein